MLIIATSYEGFALLVQIPLSVLCALVAVVLAFTRFRRVSVGFAVSGISTTLAAVGVELIGYGLHSFTRSRDNSFGFLCLVFLPMILSSFVLLFGGARGRGSRRSPRR